VRECSGETGNGKSDPSSSLEGGTMPWQACGSRKKGKRRSLVNSEVGKGSWEVEMRDGESFDCGQLVNQSTKTTLMPSLSLTLNAEP